MIRAIAVVIVLVAAGCVDQMNYSLKPPSAYGISISGYISNQAGPYSVNIYQTFDTQSSETPRVPVRAQRVTIFSNEGASEDLTFINNGEFQTSVNGIRGKVGGSYWIEIELSDGRIYKSVPDTIASGGSLETIDGNLVKVTDANGSSHYAFDITVGSSFEKENNTGRTMWSLVGTYQVLAHPELEGSPPPNPKGTCYWMGDRCNFKDPCSGLRNPNLFGWPSQFEVVDECRCCMCWYTVGNRTVRLTDAVLAPGSVKISNMLIDRIDLNRWMLMYKMNIRVDQKALSVSGYHFWRAVKNQQSSINSLFQPVMGKIKGNIEQSKGNPVPAYGIFYAAGVSSKDLWISKDDVDPSLLAPITEEAAYISCTKLFPNATTAKPAWWID